MGIREKKRGREEEEKRGREREEVLRRTDKGDSDLAKVEPGATG